MSNKITRDLLKQLIETLEKYPQERIKHLVSFKQSQIDRFSSGTNLYSDNKAPTKKPSLDEIKDIITRTSGPLGLRKDLLKKVQEALPQEQFTEEVLQQQIKSLNHIMKNKYKNYYDVSDKLYKPAGNPMYYQRLMDEVEGKNKETFATAMRTVLFGK